MPLFKKNKKEIIFNIFFIISFFWITEFALTLVKYEPSYINSLKLKKVLVKYDEIVKKKPENIKKFIEQGIRPTLYPASTHLISTFKNISTITNFKPLGSQPNKKLYLCDEGYGFITYTSDHLGFRNKKSDWSMYPYNVLLIGDSIVHGSCVSDDNTISGNLKKFGIPNINLGQGDNQPLLYGSTIVQFSNPVPPKNIVLVFTLHNDFMGGSNFEEYRNIKKNNPDYFFSTTKNYHILSSNGEKYFKLANSVVEKKINENQEYEKLSYFNSNVNFDIYSFLKLSKIRQTLKIYTGINIKKKLICYKESCIFGSIESRINKNIKNAISDIHLLLKNCNQILNCNPVVVLVSHNEYWDGDPVYKTTKKLFNEKVQNIKNNNFNFAYIDSSKFINSRDLNNYASAGGHFSNLAYAKLAELIKAELK